MGVLAVAGNVRPMCELADVFLLNYKIELGTRDWLTHCLGVTQVPPIKQRQNVHVSNHPGYVWPGTHMISTPQNAYLGLVQILY